MTMTPDERYRSRKRFFNDHAEHWLDMWYKDHESGEYRRHQRDFERLFSLLALKRGAHVLDVGCGTGVLVPYILAGISEKGLLYELDFAEKMIEANRRLHRQNNIRFILSDVEWAPLDDACCDVVICFSCFPHFQDKRKAVHVLTRILKPQGVLVVSHFDSSEGIRKHHESCEAVMNDHLPDEERMRALFKEEGLRIEALIDEPGFYYLKALR